MPYSANELLQVYVETEGSSALVRAVGEIDLLTAPLLAAAVEEAKATGATELLVDCTGVTYLGSTGIGVLVQAWRDMEDGARFRLRPELQPSVRRVLELCGLDELISEVAPAPVNGA